MIPMYDLVVVRYGELTLKGRNKKRFTQQLTKTIRTACRHLPVRFESEHDRFYIHLDDAAYDHVASALAIIPGVAGFSPAIKAEKTTEAITEASSRLLAMHLDSPKTFKVETRRADKTFAIPSMTFSRALAGRLLSAFSDLSVDVHTPDLALHVEIRQSMAFVFVDKVEGLGGFPAGIAGKGYVLLSGGIDSPVAAFLAMKQGIAIEGMHFESSPLTSIEAAQKVVDLSQCLAPYAMHQHFRLHMVPFHRLHQKILETVPEPYHIIIMRRMMFRIAARYARLDHTQVLVTGESVGQVASQTLESLNVINAVTHMPILRPLVTMDKKACIRWAQKIGTYDISIRPFEDCCAVYVPAQPATAPRDYLALRYERLFDFETEISTILKQIQVLEIKQDTSLFLPDYGLTVLEALEAIGAQT
ncbi:MAG: tRNA 4-thiouridine(8) synthase ThiI [Acholeplasmatales bacterium]|nr:MAG: tRNA 4-thiouridine(8) synthase ThiI [Acholeplasmatales bacterium]